MTAQPWPAALYLEKGHLFEGQGFGHPSPSGGEIVFNTGMTGYQEIFTDASYCRQIVVMSYPHIGNTGANLEDLESKSLDLSGVVVREFCATPSSWRSTSALHDYLRAAKKPLISDVDTREITQAIRDEGAQRAVIFPTSGLERGALEEGRRLLEKVESMEGLELVSQVSTREPYEFEAGSNDGAGTAIVYDYGVKLNILRHLKEHRFKVRVVPHDYPHQDILAQNPKLVLLSNGPGDPATVKAAPGEIQGLVGKVPVLAICMGHQLLARSLGGNTFKLKFGHHGVNHPVKDLLSDRILITSQNHGFAVEEASLKSKDIQLSHINLNDRTVEGFVSEKMKLYSVQFHPESKPGPSDAGYIFENFVRGFLR